MSHGNKTLTTELPLTIYPKELTEVRVKAAQDSLQ